MKISEVCKRTNLTKRTVRFYTEKGLLRPETVEKNSVNYYEYSEDDVKLLKAISTLRKLDISIEDISRIIKKPEEIPDIVKFYKEQSSSKYEETSRILNVFTNIKPDECTDIYSFAESAEKAGRVVELPPRDIKPDFTKFEDLTEKEKQEAYMKIHDELLIENYRKKLITKKLKPFMIVVSILLIALLIFFLYKARIIKIEYSGTASVINYENTFIQDVEVSVSGKAYVDWEHFKWSDFKEREELFRYLIGEVSIKTEDKKYIKNSDSSIGVSYYKGILVVRFLLNLEEANEIYHPGWKFEIPKEYANLGIDWDVYYDERYQNPFYSICIAIDLNNDRAYVLDLPWDVESYDEMYSLFD